MSKPANLPNQVGVQGIQALLALWISRAANAVNYLLGRTGGGTFYASAGYPGLNFVPTSTNCMVGTGWRWGTAHGSKTGISMVTVCGTLQASQAAANEFFGVALNVGTGTSPAAQAAISGTTIIQLEYGGADTTVGPYHPYCLSALVTWPAADSWLDIQVSCSVANAGLIREYTLSIFDVAL